MQAKAVACGFANTMVIDLQDNLWATGDNKYGQLGVGDKKKRRKFEQLPNFKAKTVVCGELRTVAIN